MSNTNEALEIYKLNWQAGIQAYEDALKTNIAETLDTFEEYEAGDRYEETQDYIQLLNMRLHGTEDDDYEDSVLEAICDLEGALLIDVCHQEFDINDINEIYGNYRNDEQLDELTEEATQLTEEARQRVANYINGVILDLYRELRECSD